MVVGQPQCRPTNTDDLTMCPASLFVPLSANEKPNAVHKATAHPPPTQRTHHVHSHNHTHSTQEWLQKLTCCSLDDLVYSVRDWRGHFVYVRPPEVTPSLWNWPVISGPLQHLLSSNCPRHASPSLCVYACVLMCACVCAYV
jgi:hypothetical protein